MQIFAPSKEQRERERKRKKKSSRRSRRAGTIDRIEEVIILKGAAVQVKRDSAESESSAGRNGNPKEREKEEKLDLQGGSKTTEVLRLQGGVRPYGGPFGGMEHEDWSVGEGEEQEDVGEKVSFCFSCLSSLVRKNIVKRVSNISRPAHAACVSY